MNIDPNTGLPELPDGEFWRIEENRIIIARPGKPGPWGKCTHKSRDYHNEYSGYEERDRSELIVETRRLRAPKVSEKHFVECRRSARPVTVRAKEYGEWEWIGLDKRCLTHDPITPENVVERCRGMLEERAENERRNALYGDYPPKKLEVTS